MGCHIRQIPARFRMVVPFVLGAGIHQRHLRLLFFIVYRHDGRLYNISYLDAVALGKLSANIFYREKQT
jgi:hypothetical protein